MLRMRRRTLALVCACCAAVTGWAQYQDYSQIGRTPEALRFLDDPLKIELKEPAWLFGGPKMGTPAEQLLLAERLEREGKREEAVEAYDDLVHEWHASPEALTAQLAIARLESAAGRAQQAYDADVYLLAHFAGRFELEPVLADAVAQADALAARERGRTFHLSSGATLRRNYEQIIHFAPRWKRVPELLLRIAELYVEDEEYANAITICDRLVIDWPRYAGLDDAVSVYCRACRLQADVWRNDVGRLAHLERLLAGAQAFRPNHPDRPRFAQWQREIYELRRDRAYANASFYDNPAAYSAEAALLAYQAFLRDFPDTPHAAKLRARVAELAAQARPAAQPQPKEKTP